MAARIARDRRRRGARCTTPRPTRAGSCSAPSPPSASATPTRPRSASAIVTLGSLTLTPLRLDAVTHLDPDSPQVEVDRAPPTSATARAVGAAARRPAARATALELYDVCAAGVARRATSRPAGGTVCVLGAGHAGKLALAAARDAMDGGTVVAVDVDPDAVERVRDARALRHRRRRRPARPARGARGRCARPGSPPADLTVVVVNATRLRADRDPAHRRRRAPCSSSRWRRASRPPRWPPTGSAPSARMLVGSGFAPDRGAYALDLVRRSAALREAFGVRSESRRERRHAPVQMRWQRPRRARSRQPHRRPDLPRGGPRRVPARGTGSAATSTWSAAARSRFNARDRPGAGGGHGRVRGARARDARA